MNRNDLITICERAYIPFNKWENRDSYACQVNIADIFSLLKAEAEYTTTIENETILIRFHNVSKEQIEKAKDFYLPIDDIDEFWEALPEDEKEYTEMFTAHSDLVHIDNSEYEDGIYTRYLGGYMPTKEKLDTLEGDDWY